MLAHIVPTLLNDLLPILNKLYEDYTKLCSLEILDRSLSGECMIFFVVDKSIGKFYGVRFRWY